MAATDQELLDAVNDAIAARLTGGLIQSTSVDGRNIQFVSLGELRTMKADLESRIASGTRRTNYAQFERPT